MSFRWQYRIGLSFYDEMQSLQSKDCVLQNMIQQNELEMDVVNKRMEGVMEEMQRTRAMAARLRLRMAERSGRRGVTFVEEEPASTLPTSLQLPASSADAKRTKRTKKVNVGPCDTAVGNVTTNSDS